MFTVGLAISRTVCLVAFAAASILFVPITPASAADGVGVTPVLSATVGDGEVDLSWTDWNPPPDPWEDAATVIDYRWRMKVEGGDWSDWTYVDGTSTTVPGLENGKAHTFVVVGRQRGVYLGTPWLRRSWPSEEVTVTPKAPDE